MASVLRFNNLKLAASEQAPRVCMRGARGDRASSPTRTTRPYGVGRHLRDALSARLMVANERIHADRRRPAADRQGGLSHDAEVRRGVRRSGRVPCRAHRRAVCCWSPAFPASTATAPCSRTSAGASTSWLSARGVARAAPSALRFPPLLPRRQLESSGYLQLVPAPGRQHLRLRRRRGRRRALQSERAGRHEDWSEFQRMTELTLDAGRLLPGVSGDRRARAAAARRARSSTPAAPGCSATSRRTTRPAARSSTSTSWCGSASPRRCWRGATSGPSAAWSCCARSAWPPSCDVANDPFFGRRRPDAGRQPARRSELKLELLVQIAGPEPTALRLVQPSPGPLRRHVRARAGRRRAPPTRPAWASATSGSCSRCCAPTASTPQRWPAAVRARAVAMSAPPHRHAAAACPASDPDGYRPHAAARPRAAPTSRPTATPTSSSSCCTPAATSRWPRSGIWCGWTSRATSGRSSSRRPRTSSGCSASTSTRCSPTGRCPCRSPSRSSSGRTIIVELDSLVPARHRRHQLPRRARQDLGRAPRRSTPRRRSLHYFHGAGPVRARRRGLPRHLPARASCAGRRPAAVHRARPLRRRGRGCRATSCATPPRDLLRRHLRAPARHQPVRALRRVS